MAKENLEEGRDLPLEFHTAPELMSRYATNFVIQHTDQEFILSFFEAKPPLLLGTPEERATQLRSIDSVRADCVARLIISPRRMADLIKVLQQNYSTYQQSAAKHEDEANG